MNRFDGPRGSDLKKDLWHTVVATSVTRFGDKEPRACLFLVLKLMLIEFENRHFGQLCIKPPGGCPAGDLQCHEWLCHFKASIHDGVFTLDDAKGQLKVGFCMVLRFCAHSSVKLS